MRLFLTCALVGALLGAGAPGAAARPIPARAAVGLTALRVPASRDAEVPAAMLLAAPRDSSEATRAARVFRPVRFYGGLGALAAGDALVMAGLADLWYSGDRVAWHWYSDTPGLHDDGWLDDWHNYVQQDKLGHFFVAWQLARVFGAYGRWAGLSNGRAGLFGGAVSALFQTQIEFFDGFDQAYGASRTDILANVAGGVVGGLKVAYPEGLGWFEARYSYHRSPYYDASVSGNAVLQYAGNAIKDYDGISYWLAIYPERWMPEGLQQRWPDWLGIALGYSGSGLAHPISGLAEPRFKGQDLPTRHRRQVFVGPDLDLVRRIPVPRWLVPVRTFFSFVRVPAPALEMGGRGVRWHWLYY